MLVAPLLREREREREGGEGGGRDMKMLYSLILTAYRKCKYFGIETLINISFKSFTITIKVNEVEIVFFKELNI